jgi:hypothetical protein
LSETSLSYDPFASQDVVDAAPCTLQVGAWSLRTGVHVERNLAVFADGLIPVTLQDFSASWSLEGVRLRWRAVRTNRFEVYRGLSSEGPWEPVADLSDVAPGDGGGFEAHDTTAPLESIVWYRLVGVDVDGSRQGFGPYQVSTAAPQHVRLLAPQPNPFNPNTRLRFELPHRTHATLSVLDARGRRVVTLADDVFGPGRHEVAWDGRTDNGATAASGVYFVQLSAEGRQTFGRLVLVR